MNDLVFVMYNLKLGERQKRKIVETSFTIENLSSDDEWTVDEQHDSSNEDLLNILSATKDKEIVEDDAMEEVSAFDAIDVDADADEAEMGVGTTKDLVLEDMDVTGTGSTTESDHDIDNNDKDDDSDGNGGDDGCSDDDNGAVDDQF